MTATPLGARDDEVEYEERARLSPVAWTTFGRLSYVVFWVVYALGYSALDWIRGGGPTWRAAIGAFIVLTPAALLGLGVVAICNHVDLSRDQRRSWVLHASLAMAFPMVWIFAVFLSNTLVRYAQSGVLTLRLAPSHVLHWHYLSGVLMYVGLAFATYGLRFAKAESRRRQQAEIDALRAQLSPHFLFNALHTLFALSRTDPDRGEAGISRLANLLRYSLRETRGRVPLRTDWTVCEEYLQLERLRFGDRLQWRAQLDPAALEREIPPFLLQPLLENAVRHALGEGKLPVMIDVRASAPAGVVEICIRDNGPGAQREARPTGVGLRSVATRLQALQPNPGSLRVSTAPGQGYSVTISVPSPA